MPTKGTNGVVQPLAPSTLHLIRWRMRDIRRPESHTVLENMPTCGNCHSFSADGKTLGMDIDGPANDKGLYAIVPVAAAHVDSEQGPGSLEHRRQRRSGHELDSCRRSHRTVRYVVSTFACSPESWDLRATTSPTSWTTTFCRSSIPRAASWSATTERPDVRQPLPEQTILSYVQTDGVWSPDGKYIVFARALAKASAC